MPWSSPKLAGGKAPLQNTRHNHHQLDIQQSTHHNHHQLDIQQSTAQK